MQPHHSFLRFGALAALSGLSALSLIAQIAPTPGANADSAASPNSATGAETIELSPFVVNTGKDVGFVASSALAGGRLAGDLRDTPVAYSVLTREFIDALNLTDLISATEWTVNAVDLQGDGSQEVFGNGFEVSSRGVTVSGQQRNFFPLNVNFDSYNLDRFDYARGPNAILFGNGTFGGTANVVTKRAQTDRRFGSVRFTYGSWDQRRAALDYNLPLTKTIAVRTNLLWQDKQGWRDHEMEKKQAATIAGTWKINANTEFLLEAEAGRIERNNPPTFLNDQFTGWDGVSVYPRLVTNTTVPSNAVLQLAGVSRYGNDTTPTWVFSPNLPVSTVENFSNTLRTIGGGANATTSVGGVPRPPNSPTVGYSARPIQRQLNGVPWQFDRAVRSHFRVPGDEFAISTYTPTFKQNYQAYSSFLRHRVGRSLFFELAGNVSSESRRTNYMNARQLNDVVIDLNETLPSGQPNPMFLQPFGQGQRSRGQFGNKYTSGRLAAAYQTERTRIGEFTFNLMGGLTDQTWTQKIESMRVFRDSDPRNWPFNDQVFYRYYWNAPDKSLPEINSATFNGVTYPVRWIGDSQRATDISFTNTQFGYLQGAIKGKFFNNRLHGVLAGRRDDLTVQRTINDNYGDYPANWNGRDYQFRPPAPADYLTLGEVRPRNATRIPTVTTGRYQDDYNPPDVDLKATTYTTGLVYHLTRSISLFANYATSFNPSTSQLRLDGSIMPSPESSGWDTGLRFYLFGERINVSLTYYEGEETAQPFEIPFTNNLQDIAMANVVGDLSTDGVNRRGMPIVPRQAFDRRDRENHGYELEVTANLTRHWRLSANGARAYAYQTNAWADTRAFIGQWEPTMRLVLADAGVVFNSLGEAVVNNAIPADQRPASSTAASAWNNVFRAQLPNIVAGKQLIPGLTEVSANIFTDYEFNGSFLKGLRTGAGVNYRGKKVIGFRGADTVQDPARPSDPGAAIDNPNVDAFTPIYSDSYYTTTVTLSYSYRLRDRKRLQFHLRISNLLNDDNVIYTGSSVPRAPGGDYTTTAARVATPSNFRYQVPRSYAFTTTLSF
jgi:outer membrane receptor protein involved in Fe transport